MAGGGGLALSMILIILLKIAERSLDEESLFHLRDRELLSLSRYSRHDFGANLHSGEAFGLGL